MGFFHHTDKGNSPAFLIEYEKANKIRVGKNTSFEQLPFVVIDTESSGLDKKDKILSIGGIGIEDRAIQLTDILEVTIQQSDVNIDPSVEIHGIMPAQLQKGLLPAKALEKIITFLGNRIIVGHHINFDLQLLNNMAGSLYKGAKILNPSIDIALLYKRLQFFGNPYPVDPDKLMLDSICAHFNIETTDRHTACGDAFITAQVFLKLLAWANNRGINTYGEIMKTRG